MKYNEGFSRKAFKVFNYIFISFVSILCIMPFINILAISLSDSTSVAAGDVTFLPVNINIKAYQFVMQSEIFSKAFFVSVKRVILGVAVNMLFTIHAAYPLSKEKSSFKKRGIYAWFFMVTMLLNAGLIPWYMVIKSLGLIDKIWALILPGALPVFNMVVLLNFFRGLPKELEEAAFIDGAGHWRILWGIFIPLSKPALATVGLFCMVHHWNAWFDGLILMNKSEHYPLQSYLQTIVINPEAFFRSGIGTADLNHFLNYVNARTSRAAQLFISMIPILLAYPFLQKYFTTGLVVGSVKG